MKRIASAAIVALVGALALAAQQLPESAAFADRTAALISLR